jgi:hypothetical protein
MNIEQRFALCPYAGQHSAHILRRFGEANNASDASVESVESLVLLFLAGHLKKGLRRTDLVQVRFMANQTFTSTSQRNQRMS